MSFITIINSSVNGRINSSLGLANKLKNEGHQITFICQNNAIEKIEKQGFSYISIPEINFNYKNPKTKGKEYSWLKKFIDHFKNYSNNYKEGKLKLNLKKYENIIHQIHSDLILVDLELHDLIFASIANKIPVVLFTTWFSNNISLNTPPINSSVLPDKKNGLRSKSLIIIAWTYNRIRFWSRLYLDTFTFKNHRRIVIKKYADEIGFNTKGLVPNNLPPLFSFNNLPIISLTMSELEFPHRYQKNLTYVGPMVYDNREKLYIDDEITSKINSILKLKKDLKKKLVYCSVSTFIKGDINFLKKVINAVINEPEWILIISLGGNLSKKDFLNIPENVYIFDLVPQLKILEQADISINHGGINSINECIHFSIPMLIYSSKKFDQNGNAARMSYHGIAIRGNKDKDSGQTINKNINEILSNTSFKNRISEFNKIYNTYRKQKITPFLKNHF